MQTEAGQALFTAVYGPDVELAPTNADVDIVGSMKQAVYQLSEFERAEAAIAVALATICACEPEAIVLDTAAVGEAVQEPLEALIKMWRSVWRDVRDADARVAAAEQALVEEQSAAQHMRDVMAEFDASRVCSFSSRRCPTWWVRHETGGHAKPSDACR